MQSNSCSQNGSLSFGVLVLLISASAIALLIVFAFAYSYKRNVWSVADKADWTAQCTIAFADLPPSVAEVYCECAQKALNGWRPYSWFNDGKSTTEAEQTYMRNVHMICAQKAIQVFGVMSPTL